MAAETMLVAAALKVLPTPTYTMMFVSCCITFACGIFSTHRIRELLSFGTVFGVVKGVVLSVIILAAYFAYKFFVRG